MELFIKNMVCSRCILVVEELLKKRRQTIAYIELGKVKIQNELTVNQVVEIESDLNNYGFELLDNEIQVLISSIKNTIIQSVFEDGFIENRNLSDVLAEQLCKNYSTLSKLFSQVEGMTIEKFSQKIKIERIKELLIYNEMTISEIATKMNYSSTAYLSNQFKKETGLTPSFFRKTKIPKRKSLDSI